MRFSNRLELIRCFVGYAKGTDVLMVNGYRSNFSNVRQLRCVWLPFVWLGTCCENVFADLLDSDDMFCQLHYFPALISLLTCCEEIAKEIISLVDSYHENRS